MLIKEEIQATSTSDKRTTIEVLVTKDKLECANGKTSCVSSELQFADGLTKESAGQLLADRLRSHVTRLKTDETFQASKKKDAATRKRNTEMYAIKKPKRALQAMSAVLTGAFAQTNNYENDECKIQNQPYFDIAGYLTILLTLFATILVIFLSYLWWNGNFAVAHPEPEQEPDETAVQRLRDEVTGLRREIDMHHRDKVRLRGALEDRIADYQRLLKTYKDYQAEHGPQSSTEAVHRAAQSFIYMDDGSRFWHSSYYCARDRTDRDILKINWCRRCCFNLGAADNGPRPPDRALSQQRRGRGKVFETTQARCCEPTVASCPCRYSGGGRRNIGDALDPEMRAGYRSSKYFGEKGENLDRNCTSSGSLE
eukprot:s1779_g7.t1